ncbi:MAG: hypothetical protein AB7I19_13960 [Planctomycetota bacterium]
MKNRALACIGLGLCSVFSLVQGRELGADDETKLASAWLAELLDRDFDRALTAYGELATASSRSDVRPMALARSAEIHRIRGADETADRALREIEWRGRRTNVEPLDIPRAALVEAMSMPKGAQRSRALAEAREGLRMQIESIPAEGHPGLRPFTSSARWRFAPLDPVDATERMRAKWRVLCVRLASEGELESADRLRQRLGAAATTRGLREVREDAALSGAERDALGEFIARSEIWRAEGNGDLAERARKVLPY